MIGNILGKGYFPQELPPPFITQPFANFIVSNLNTLNHPFINDPKRKNITSRCGKFNLARVSSLRRILSIPNPINHAQLAYIIHTEWNDIQSHVKQSTLSRSTPIISHSGDRAFARTTQQRDLPEVRASHRVGHRYLLKTDINTFYHSIYTHSIPWALHTKPIAKSQRRYKQLLGNRIDTLIRDGQDQQTKGIPIGPDISLLIAESILTSIDIELSKRTHVRGFRYLDDYEFCFSSYDKAHDTLAILQELMLEYELQLNPSKTKIVDLPTRIESTWVSDLHRFQFRSSERLQKSDLIHYFGQAFELWRNYPDEYVLKYAVSRSKSINIMQSNWSIYENMLLSCVLAEPSALDVVIDQFKRYLSEGYSINKDLIQETFARIIEDNAHYGRSSEVAWVIWGSLILQIPIDNSTAKIISFMNDPVVALLALDAKSKGIIKRSNQFSNWNQFMTSGDLYEQNWLIAYEAFEQGWLSANAASDYISNDQHFLILRNAGIKFYDTQRSSLYAPPRIQKYIEFNVASESLPSPY